MRPVAATASAAVVAILACCLLRPAVPARGNDGGSAVVYYQVTYADGTVRDLSEPPTRKADIRRVLRIAHYDSGQRGYEVLATGWRPPVTIVHGGRTIWRDMRWNGKAWVAVCPPGQHPPAAEPEENQDLRQIELTETARVQQQLRELHGQLKTLQQAVAAAENKLTKATGAEAEAARAELVSARKAADRCLQLIQDAQRLLEAMGGVKLDRPTGTIQPVEGNEAPPGARGIQAPVRQRRVLPHRVHVWKLPAAEGQRTYVVTMAHPEAGSLGAFHYLAYADTDGDGLPDKLIGHSPLAQAARPGGWTRWQFSTDEPVVFVGNAWPHPDTAVYCQPIGPARGNWSGLGTEVYVSGWPGLVPRQRWRHWPYLTNIRVWVPNQNPDLPSPARGSRIIVQEPR